MILRKIVNEDGKIVYEPIEFKEAVNINKTELVFTDEDEEEKYDHFGDETDEETKIKNKNVSFDFSKLANLGSKISERFTSNRNTQNPKIQKLIGILPFLDDEDIKEIVDEIINNSQDYKDLPLAAIMPFLSDKDADRLFMELVVKDGVSEGNNLSSLAPFVSEECLEKFVDEYINGRYQYVNIDSLYPFMDSKTVKKLFRHQLIKRQNE